MLEGHHSLPFPSTSIAMYLRPCTQWLLWIPCIASCNHDELCKSKLQLQWYHALTKAAMMDLLWIAKSNHNGTMSVYMATTMISWIARCNHNGIQQSAYVITITLHDLQKNHSAHLLIATTITMIMKSSQKATAMCCFLKTQKRSWWTVANHKSECNYLWAQERATAKNRHALQVLLWWTRQLTQKQVWKHFANSWEQEQWSLWTGKSKQDQLPAHKCDCKEVCNSPRTIKIQCRNLQTQLWWTENAVIVTNTTFRKMQNKSNHNDPWELQRATMMLHSQWAMSSV